MACETDGVGASRPKALHPGIKGAQFPEGTTVVVIAVDRSKQAENAVQYYFKRFHKPENQVVLLHVPELSNVTVRMGRGSPPPYEDVQTMWDEERANWDGLKHKFSRILKAYQVSWKFEVEPGAHPGQTIVEFAEKSRASLLMTGTRGLGTIRRTVMGSVSDYVLHHANSPVLVYRDPQ